MACFKNTGTKDKPKFVRDEDKSTSDNVHGSEEGFKKAQAAEQEASSDKPTKSAAKAGKGA